MTWVKKINTDWQPKEHLGIIVGDVVDFPGPVQRLVEEGNVVLCDEKGTELSAYNELGIVTNRELQEFKEWKEQQKQEAIKKSLEAEHDELLAQAAKLKAEVKKTETVMAPATPETTGSTQTELRSEKKKSDFAEKMAAARAKKKAEREAAK